MTEVVVKFKDELAKRLFLELMGDQGMEAALTEIARRDHQRAIEPLVTVVGDEVIVESVIKDKGLVWAFNGKQHDLVSYTRVDIGQKYMAVQGGRAMVYVKSAEDIADVPVGVPPTLNEVVADLQEESVDVKKIKPVKK